MSELLLKNTKQLYLVSNNTNTDSKDKWFNTYDLPILQLSSVNQVLIAEDGTGNMDQNHTNCLHRNLASFNPVSGDGVCTFRSVIVQLPKNKVWKDQNAILMEHLAGLGLGKGLDEDVFQFRQCFMDTVQINEHYLMFSEETVIGETIYIAYTTCGPGHYHGTMLTPVSNTAQIAQNFGAMVLSLAYVAMGLHADYIRNTFDGCPVTC
ncbi:hypothetical protein P5673_023117 [Acropora cervicornis]|uniref:OTU domain-containing protein n=1 Tax=Acropora cervicornis TaxID=6130 RepID=A0AAD9Q5G5_ACRCE|nr:hypothetical protein P5673_023117 [Acropora cervicornis]